MVQERVGIERIILRLKYLSVNLEWLQYVALIYAALQKWSLKHIQIAKGNGCSSICWNTAESHQLFPCDLHKYIQQCNQLNSTPRHCHIAATMHGHSDHRKSFCNQTDSTKELTDLYQSQQGAPHRDQLSGLTLGNFCEGPQGDSHSKTVFHGYTTR